MTAVDLLKELVEAFVYGDPGMMPRIALSADLQTRKKAAELAQVRLYGGMLKPDEKKALQAAITILAAPTGSVLPPASAPASSPSSSTKLFTPRNIALGGVALIATWFFIRKK